MPLYILATEEFGDDYEGLAPVVNYFDTEVSFHHGPFVVTRVMSKYRLEQRPAGRPAVSDPVISDLSLDDILPIEHMTSQHQDRVRRACASLNLAVKSRRLIWHPEEKKWKLLG